MSWIPGSRRGALARFALGAAIVIVFTATTTAVAGLLQFKQLATDLSATPAIRHAQVTVPNPGDAQTILILGSDHRAHTPLSASNSDTIILVRMDPSSSTINVISIPRDLQVQIPVPGGGVQTAKINAAYSLGGPNLVVKTIRANVFPDLAVNHIVDINFAGFRDLVNAIGCVYTDVDHRYFNQNIGTIDTNYSSIDIAPGYQKLCGDDALAYVRYRHTDTDIVRSARQQDFIRQAKDQYGQANLISNRDRLLRIFGQHTQTDPNLHTTDGLINLFNLVAFSDAHSIREVHFPASLLPCTKTACFVTADPGAEAQAFREFMAVVPAATATPAADAPAGGGAPKPAPTPGSAAAAAGLTADLPDGRTQTAALPNAGLPVYFPRLIVAGSNYDGPTAREYPRGYTIADPSGERHTAYRIVVVLNSLLGQYYGVQGTTWANPPLLASPSETRVVNGRTLELFFDGHKLRLVAWRGPHGVYWVSNTLSLDLTNAQMLGVAGSLVRVGAGA
jgi:polyisoprenyl-teichoic acid--peptidoglycan teichoic acid transferase